MLTKIMTECWWRISLCRFWMPKDRRYPHTTMKLNSMKLALYILHDQNKLDRDFLCWQLSSVVCPEKLSKITLIPSISTGLQRRRVSRSTYTIWIGHFRVVLSLFFKTRVSAKSLLWKYFSILIQIKLIFIWKVLHLASFWRREIFELGNGLFKEHFHISVS